MSRSQKDTSERPNQSALISLAVISQRSWLPQWWCQELWRECYHMTSLFKDCATSWEVREAPSSERNQWVVFGRDRESNSPKVTQSQNRWNGQPWTRHYFRASHPASLFPLMVCSKMGMLQFQMIFCGNKMLDALKMKTILREIGHGALWGWWDGWWVLLKHKEINKLASRYNFKRTAVLISGLASPGPFQQKVKFQAGTSLSSTRSTPVTSPWAGLWKAI